MKAKLILLAGAALTLAACGTSPGERAVSGGLMGAAAGAVIGNNVGDGDAATGAIIGGATGAVAGAVTAPSNRAPSNRRQRYDERTGRYYFYDPGTDRYFYENGEPYP